MRKIFEYLTTEIKPDEFDSELTKSGLLGWEFISVIVMQKPKFGINPGQPQYEVKFLLVFKKEIIVPKE